MGADSKRPQFGPVYLDELQSVEVRSLSWGARDLWTVLGARTRSLRVAPDKHHGWKVPLSELAQDIGRFDAKAGELRPVSTRTVKRYIRELKDAGLLEVQWTRGWATFILLRPPSLLEQPVENPVDRSMEIRARRYQAVPKMGQKSVHDGTRMGGPSPSIDPQLPSNSSEKDGTPVAKMAAWMLMMRALGSQAEEHECFSKLGFQTWDEAARLAPQLVRGTLKRFRPDGISKKEFDLLIQEAGGACERRAGKIWPRRAVVDSLRTARPELEIPPDATPEEADQLFQDDLSRQTGF